MEQKPKLKIKAESLKFVLPYIQRELPDYELVEDGEADFTACLLTPDEASGANDTAEPGATTLICPNVVGTGMNGWPMAIAEAIARGRYFNIKENEERLSTVHASDVAVAVRLSLGKGGKHIVTDLNDPRQIDFAEAIAHRLNDKRIFTVSRTWAPWLMGRKLFNYVTQSDLYEGEDFAITFGFKPTPVVEYLRTHVYDDESL